jgi:uncharacterized protein YbcC (UPF0753/DUF2309 family)
MKNQLNINFKMITQNKHKQQKKVNPLFKFYIDFEDKRKVRREMIAETEEEVKIYISNKYKTDKFLVIKDKQIGVRIK